MKLVKSNAHETENNNFDLLRLTFALMVCFVHMADLSTLNSLDPIVHFISSSLALC
jgi:hypothetical protein